MGRSQEKNCERGWRKRLATAKGQKPRAGKVLKGRAPEQWKGGRAAGNEAGGLGWVIMKTLIGQGKDFPLCPKGNGKPLTGLTEEWHDQIFIFKRFADFSAENVWKVGREDLWRGPHEQTDPNSALQGCYPGAVVGGVSPGPHSGAQKKAHCRAPSTKPRQARGKQHPLGGKGGNNTLRLSSCGKQIQIKQRMVRKGGPKASN